MQVEDRLKTHHVSQTFPLSENVVCLSCPYGGSLVCLYRTQGVLMKCPIGDCRMQLTYPSVGF